MGQTAFIFVLRDSGKELKRGRGFLQGEWLTTFEPELIFTIFSMEKSCASLENHLKAVFFEKLSKFPCSICCIELSPSHGLHPRATSRDRRNGHILRRHGAGLNLGVSICYRRQMSEVGAEKAVRKRVAFCSGI
jgi:hypothetical protein